MNHKDNSFFLRQVVLENEESEDLGLENIIGRRIVLMEKKDEEESDGEE